MLFAESFADDQTPASDRLVLPYEVRRKSRQRVTLASGEELGYVLPSGTVLRQGDRLLTGNGLVVEVEAAPEALLEVRTSDSLQLVCAAYHLGNRHVAVQFGDGFLRFQPDHVLAEMLVGLGCTVSEVEAPFDPEGGAYGANAHVDSHSRRHGYRPLSGADVSEPHHPGHGAHRSPARIHEFK
ncbi:MAG: Urease accessory protein UreE 1 [Candidatus Accumulibacter regalis]|jgi:urease accessory protein|uniref:Urease accessory protein UreE n=1 Tax=Accumulibacter regalis TaxID=522306 RepID=A0A011QGY5_ACCRE|nr:MULTISPECIES: urease accessory protein UreE [unclassified Candidatus Accumulibacter]EXI88330.1 MAG: Urease accessory protein UreE 1 [Candidatus Accumulibacter regalis]HRE71232.1 urease accessory protein UreE [Accumulibacter sp.]HRE85838.1 urease accessory protein UreE [Accumulibacter sp.]HRI91349.1 urease accessory protein UreE [Accumulibacter sp.]